MIPLYDENPTRTKPLVVWGLILANVLIFGYEFYLFQTAPEVVIRFFDDWAVIPQQLFKRPTAEAITLVSSQFLHGGVLHLLGNVWFLWIFGNNVEEQLGHIRFLCFYLVCGLVAGLAQAAIGPGSEIPVVGASGAIAGVMGAYVVRFPRAKIVTLIPIVIFFTTVRIPAIFFLGYWIALQVLLHFMADVGQPGVAYLAHISGFFVGAFYLKFFDIPPPRKW
ncbi:Peptidase S54, rhomboid domain protein [Thalassoporum mexicanum PCC 7367]|uniref:rhomboid family intramembrane serine protease n=1 Tax=Thalassoporum mexicanum TaxID=3457544 RepID=UPI00029FEEA7|nr:rhomboid family intramembrane serine protease [Pseudanabaena sp. PCC 7367]AFY68533.1 Peptidase S54, rhomboid domain protein [Pseudanabaena sp. PCC 7367]